MTLAKKFPFNIAESKDYHIVMCFLWIKFKNFKKIYVFSSRQTFGQFFGNWPTVEWNESIIILIYEKGDETDCSNCTGLSLLSSAYKILSYILLSRLTPYAKKIIGDHQCGFRRNRSTTDHIFCIRLIKKGKAVPLQAWSGPEGSRKLRFPDFMTTAQEGGKVFSRTHRPHLPPGDPPGTHFC
jgi:hypothetical protein